MTSGDAIATTTVWRLHDVHCTTSTSNELVCGCRRCALACPALLTPICVQEESGYFAGNLNNSLNRVSRQCAVCSAVQCTAVPLTGILYTSGDFSFSSFLFLLATLCAFCVSLLACSPECCRQRVTDNLCPFVFVVCCLCCLCLLSITITIATVCVVLWQSTGVRAAGVCFAVCLPTNSILTVTGSFFWADSIDVTKCEAV